MIFSAPKASLTQLLQVVVVQVLLVLLHQIGSLDTASSSTIQQGQTLKDSDALESPNGLFRLGFSGAGPLNSRYLAISFNAGAAINVNPVWVGNRNAPLSDSSGLLSIDYNGTLKLENADRSISIVFYSPDPDQVSRINSNSSLVTATLLDNGNFVLVEKNSTTGYERLLWQSFNYPTDALLPGMRLSINRKTGQTKSLTSWLSDKVPYSGAFTLGVSPVSNENELVIQRRGVTYWRSGAWTGRGFGFPSALMNLNDPQYTFSYNVGEEKYFSYNKKTESADIMVWVLSEMGELQMYSVGESGGMSIPATVIQCGTRNGNTTAAGCETPELPSCRSGRVQFRPRRGRMASNASVLVTRRGAVDLNVSTSDCEDECRRNCSCVAYTPASPIDHVGCYFWSKGSQFIKDEKLDNLVYFLPSRRAMKRWMWFLMAVAIALVLLLIIPLIYLRWKRIRPFGDGGQTQRDVLIQLRTMSTSEDGGESLDFQLFNLDTVLSATDSFSSANKLGEGGFGPVYRGKLVGGQQIAVKRLSGKSGQGLKEFKNEIILIAKLQHMNLVRLLGCCIHGEERILIYEYMPNNSLESLIFDPVGRKLLDWNKRLKVIEGIAQGLLYLHQYSRLRIIHRDLKAGNILLDADMNAKISDFGTARIFKQNESGNTKRIIGTYGYMSPEYAMNGIFSVKSDVFSFGVLLLEIVSGRKNTSFDEFDSHLNLIGFAWELWQRNAIAELMDPLLAATSCSDNGRRFARCIHVGLLCVQERAVDRPTMLEVVSMFANEAMVLPSPKQPAFSTGENLMEPFMCREESAMCSHNSVTVSTLSGR